MPGLVPGIHVFCAAPKTWMAGTSPAMTTLRLELIRPDNHLSGGAHFSTDD
jgi:hypothetical protein